MVIRILSIITALSILFFSTTLLATDPEHIQRQKRSYQLDRVQITQEEYDKKIKHSNTIMLTGGIVGGVGLAGLATGLAMALTTENNSDATFGNAMAGVIVGGLGGLVMIAGGITAVVGGVKKKHTKEKYYTLSPTIDTEKDLYGLNLSVSF
jgi:hypothetical protein